MVNVCDNACTTVGSTCSLPYSLRQYGHLYVPLFFNSLKHSLHIPCLHFNILLLLVSIKHIGQLMHSGLS